MRALLLAAMIAATVPASAHAGAIVTMDYTNPGLVPAHWVLQIHSDGSAHFHSERGAAPHNPTEGIEAPDLDRDIQLSPRFAQHVFDIAHHKRRFQTECESHMKVAYQGTKKLSYSGPDGTGACEFNYSKDPEIQALGDDLLSVANTIVEGARLQSLLQHDRLGLDRETEILTQSAAEGRAQQIGSIRDILEQLASDDSVLERVRRRARALLTRSDN